MIHPTRTELLQLRERRRTAGDSLRILQASRQVLLQEFLASVAPFGASRDALRRQYRQALTALEETRRFDGEAVPLSLAAITPVELRVQIHEQNLLGVRCREVRPDRSARRVPGDRPFDPATHVADLTEAVDRFEILVDKLVEIASYEHKLKRIGEAIQRVTRRIRLLEQRLLPTLGKEIRQVNQYLGEREREAGYRLKRFKERR